MFRRCAGLGRALLLLALLFRWLPEAGAAEVVIRDGGINPASLGKGDWIWYVSQATNKLGGAAPSVVNLPTLMSFYKSQGLQYIIVKAGTGSTNFNGSGSSPQFNSNLVYHAHAAGLLIFAYTRSYDDDVPGEINMAANCFAVGADGWVIDAEAEWESGASQAGTNGPTRAIQYGQGLRALFPTKFIAHAPFPIISFHSSFPYKEFGYFCDAVMPQAYWTEIYDEVDPVQRMFTAMDNEYRNWQNSLTGIWTNAIKPIAPIAQAWSSTSGLTTGAEIDEFFDRCRTNPNPASVTGYAGMSYWRADTKDAGMWEAIRTNVLGDVPGLPNLTMQPQSRTVVVGTNVTFTAWGTGSKPFYYRWRFNGSNLTGPGAASPNLVLTNVQFVHAGAYSVVVSNVAGVTTSMVAMLNVTAPPTLFDVAVTPGGRSAIITWRSTNAADSQVEYGLTPAYGLMSPRDLRQTTNHTVVVSGLEPGSSYYFGVVSRVGDSTYRADGGVFSTAGELVLDNTAATFSGNWLSGTSSADKFGADYRYITNVSGGNTASAIYAPEVVVPGSYDVHIWYPQGSNRSTNTPVAIFYSGGATNVRVNQEADGGGWRVVGSNLKFRSGQNGFVRIGNGTSESTGSQVVMADGVRLVYRADQETPAGAVVPDWWATHFFGAPVNAQLDHDGDGYSTWMEYLAGTLPTEASSAVRLMLNLEGATTLRAEFTPCLPGRRYRLERKLSGLGWEVLPILPVTVDLDGRGSMTMPIPADPMQWFRLRIEWDQ